MGGKAFSCKGLKREGKKVKSKKKKFLYPYQDRQHTRQIQKETPPPTE